MANKLISKFEIDCNYEFTNKDGKSIRGKFVGGLCPTFECGDKITKTIEELIEVEGFINVIKID
ncbi:MAG: hypothetical protein IKT84_06065 [Bacteroidales bacterium]|nr:hypothetical protein [Bacteroidales bacterium]